jgi:hypothetical protein
MCNRHAEFLCHQQQQLVIAVKGQVELEFEK